MTKNDNVDSFQSHIHVHVLTQTQIENEAGCTDLQIIRVERDICCGGQLSPAFKLYWRKPGPISSLIRTNGVRKGQTKYPV